MRYLVVLVLVTACGGTTEPEPIIQLGGNWSVEGAGPISVAACAFNAEVTLVGTSKEYDGSGVIQRASDASARSVTVVGSTNYVGLVFSSGHFTLDTKERHETVLRGTFSCGGGTGTWSMFRVP